MLEPKATVIDVLWQEAQDLDNSISLDILLRYKVSFEPEDWYRACYNWLLKTRWGKIVDAAEETRRKRIFDAIACRLSPYTDVRSESTNSEISESISCIPFLYHANSLCTLAADSAWRFGHRNLNDYTTSGSTDTLIGGLRGHGTSLWVISITTSVYVWQSKWNIFSWLIEHGAEPFWIHPLYLTTPAHVLSRTISKIAADLKSFEPPDDAGEFLLKMQRDRCVCRCSRNGCYPIGCAMSSCNLAHRVSPSARTKQRAFHRRTTQPRLFALIDSSRERAWMSSAALRLLTFESLSLTHTCCISILKYPAWSSGIAIPPTPQEVRVIHEIEVDDIKLFEILVTGFEAKWAAYNKPFVTFMNRVWKPRMRAMRVERRIEKSLYQEELRRMGVTLEEMDRKSKKDSDLESDSDWPDEYESETDGWYTTDDEDGESGDEEHEIEVNEPSGDCSNGSR
jgi:hypothetical protein